jgi:basic membrane protein A
MKKLLALMLTLIMSLSVFTGCASKGVSSDKKEGKKRVAIILEGAISDMSWNATAYAGLKKIEAMGAEVAYVENVPASSVADSIRTYADEKYDVIFLSTNSYADPGATAAKDYPNTQFFMINSSVVAKNVASFGIQDAEQGFLMGALAGLLTKTGTVGFVGGLEINPIINGGKGFSQGAKYVKPDVKVIATNTGSFDNVSAAKETAKAMVGQGVDVGTYG